MIDNIEVGKTIAKLRQNRGMTQQQLAAALNVSHQAVSKWENGAALPDVQTLLNLTGLFGVTVEQLLNGEVPEDRTAPEGRSPLEDTLQSVGNAVNSFVTGLFAGAKREEAAPEEAPGAEPQAEADEAPAEAEEPAEEPAEESAEAAGEAAEETGEAQDERFDLGNLLRMAPFMTKQAVGELLLEHRDELSSNDIARFAPFITRECLEELIQKSESEISWETLRRVAPFLKREMVDRLAWVAAKGGKFAREAADQVCRNPEELGRSLGEVSQRIGAGMEKALRHAAKLGGDAVNEAGKALNDIFEGLKAREDRAATLRRAAVERAVQDGKWDWIAAHLDELDEETKRAVARKANEAGMHDWVVEHLEDYLDADAVDAAMERGDWGWLGEHAWQLDAELQQRVALAAAKDGNWLWLTGYAELLDLGDVAGQVACAAYEAGEKALALTLAEGMAADQREILANAVLAAGDDDTLEKLIEALDGDFSDRLCLARAQAGNWDGALRFIDRAGVGAVEQLMELAIAEGNFDAIDRLNPRL